MLTEASRIFRGLLAKSIFLTRDRLRRRAATTSGSRPLLLWPPVDTATEWNTTAARLNWLAPAMPEPIRIFAPRAHPFAMLSTNLAASGLQEVDRHRIDLTPCDTAEQLKAVLALRPLILLWKAFSWRVVPVLRRFMDFYIIDPTFFGSFEEIEWMRLYFQHSAPEKMQALRSRSAATYESFLQAASAYRYINVCGNGPGLLELTPVASAGALNMVCNTAIESRDLMKQLRPLAIGFIDSVLFGPSLFARRYMDAVRECVEAYGSYVFVPAGYAEFLLDRHYDFLRGHLVGLELVQSMTHPTPQSLQATMAGSVVTCLLLPVALGVRPNAIGIWGCDGRSAAQKGTWNYKSGLVPKLHEAARAHPAYFRDRGAQLQPDSFYKAYCDHFDALLTYIEGQNVRVECRSRSFVPALTARFHAGVDLRKTAVH